MSFYDRLQAAADTHESTFAACYSEAGGNERKAKRMLRRRLFAAAKNDGAYKLDPATIAMVFALIQLAFKVWEWAKDNGYLASYIPQDAPMRAMLAAGIEKGEFLESVETPLLVEMFDDDDE